MGKSFVNKGKDYFNSFEGLFVGSRNWNRLFLCVDFLENLTQSRLGENKKGKYGRGFEEQ